MLTFMLDSNITIYVLKERPANALKSFNQYSGQMCISSITLAELMHGVEKSAYPEHNLRQVEDFISRLQVLDYGTNAAAHYGDIRTSLQRIGKPIGVNDLHVAGHARSEDLVLVTNNLAEFERIEGLKLENWV